MMHALLSNVHEIFQPINCSKMNKHYLGAKDACSAPRVMNDEFQSIKCNLKRYFGSL